MLAPLLAVTLALPATGQDTTFQLTASGSVGVTDYSSGQPDLAGARSLTGSGGLAITGFLNPVIDDDAPPSLQPFLQRAGSFSLFGGGGHTSFTRPPQLGPSGETTFGNVGVDGSGYFGRALFVGAGLSLSYATHQFVGYAEHDSFLALPLYVSAGVRWRALLVNAGWRVAPARNNEDAFAVSFWGNAYLNVYGVIGRRASIGGVVDVLDGGAAASVRFSIWTARRLGFGVSGGGGHAAPAAPARAYDFARGRVFAEVWVAPRAALSLVYELAWTRYVATTVPSSDAIMHGVSLEVTGRPW
jgi:hypothetical protein